MKQAGQGKRALEPCYNPLHHGRNLLRPSNANLSALRPLVPFALAYRGRIAAALAALVAASAATLVVPLAVRRVVDHGFAAEGAEVINAYFAMLILVVGVLAVASSLRYYFVITLGERVVADLRDAVFGI